MTYGTLFKLFLNFIYHRIIKYYFMGTYVQIIKICYYDYYLLLVVLYVVCYGGLNYCGK